MTCRGAAGLCVVALLLGAAPALAAQAPPAQGTVLHFQRTLFIQATADGRIFAETHRTGPDDTLPKILKDEYGIGEAAQAPLIQAFRGLNPGVDPSRLPPGQVVRIPFKVEELPSGSPRAPAESQPVTHTIRPGESLWKVLRKRFGVTKEGMARALAAVSRANPGIRDLNHVVPGQAVVIPRDIPPASGDRLPPKTFPATLRSVIDLFRVMNCQVNDHGETSLPLSRGRSVRLDGRDFPIITGPTGRRVVLDPHARMSAALVRSIEQAWRYTVIRGASPDAEAEIDRLLPHLGFHEVSRGTRIANLARGVDLLASTRWTVVPRPKDLWEGNVHLLFGAGASLDPAVIALAMKAGFSIHLLGGEVPTAVPMEPSDVPQLAMADPAQGTGRLLGLLGVPHEVRPEVECNLGGGIRYRVRPLLTFEHGGLAYAVPPKEPERAEELLAKAGYFTLPWQEKARPLQMLGDILALLGMPGVRGAVEAPQDQGMRLRVEGLTIDGTKLVPALYPQLPNARAGGRRVLVTEADLTPATARVFQAEGFFPLVVRLDAE